MLNTKVYSGLRAGWVMEVLVCVGADHPRPTSADSTVLSLNWTVLNRYLGDRPIVAALQNPRLYGLPLHDTV